MRGQESIIQWIVLMVIAIIVISLIVIGQMRDDGGGLVAAVADIVGFGYG